MFSSCYDSCMRNPHLGPPTIKNRDDLIRLIAQAVRLQLGYLDEKKALAVADTILRSFKAAGLAIRKRR